MKRIITFLFLAAALHLSAQKTLTIEQCYGLARQNYPLLKQHDLIQKNKRFYPPECMAWLYPADQCKWTGNVSVRDYKFC